MNAFLSLADIGDSLREAFFMFWATLWALDPRLHAVGRGAGVRVEATDASRHGRSRRRGGRARIGIRHGLVELFVRRDRDGEVAVPKGRRLHDRDDLHVRVDEPRRRARHRAARVDGLAVRARGVRRWPDHDRRSRARRRRRVLAEARRSRARPLATERGEPDVATSTTTSTITIAIGTTKRMPTTTARRSRPAPVGVTRPRFTCPTSACCAASSSSVTSSPASSPCSFRWSGGTTLFMPRPRLLDDARKRA